MAREHMGRYASANISAASRYIKIKQAHLAVEEGFSYGVYNHKRQMMPRGRGTLYAQSRVLRRGVSRLSSITHL